MEVRNFDDEALIFLRAEQHRIGTSGEGVVLLHMTYSQRDETIVQEFLNIAVILAPAHARQIATHLLEAAERAEAVISATPKH